MERKLETCFVFHKLAQGERNIENLVAATNRGNEENCWLKSVAEKCGFDSEVTFL